MPFAVLSLMLVPLAGCGGGEKADGNNAANNAAPAIAAPIVEGNNAVEAENEAALPVAETPAPKPPKAPAPTPAPDKADYRAIGTEPFWAVTIRGDVATLERPDHKPEPFDVVRIDNAGSVSWSGDGLSMRIKPGPCSDGMSDAIWSDSVQVATGDGTLKGCGGMRDDGGDRDR
jgi:uncharacterized membrane protein